MRFSQCNATVPMHLARELAACGEATIAFRHERPGLRCLRSKLVLGPKGHDRHQGRACLECWVGFRAEDEFSFVLSGAVECRVKAVRLMQVREHVQRGGKDLVLAVVLRGQSALVYGLTLQALVVASLLFICVSLPVGPLSGATSSSRGCIYTTLFPGQPDTGLALSPSTSP
jgi:hypothetical protein